MYKDRRIAWQCLLLHLNSCLLVQVGGLGLSRIGRAPDLSMRGGAAKKSLDNARRTLVESHETDSPNSHKQFEDMELSLDETEPTLQLSRLSQRLTLAPGGRVRRAKSAGKRTKAG